MSASPGCGTILRTITEPRISTPTPRLKFGEWEFDPRSGELWRDGRSAVLPNQLFRILAFLTHRRGDLVTRDELCRELWPGETFVDFEHSLNAGVKRLREALGDSAAAPRFIETVPQRGYRFIADVQENLVLVDATSVVRDRLRKWPLRPAALLAALPFLYALGSPQQTSTLEPDPNRRLARLTSTSGLNTEPALSPDGTLLAYASDRASTDSEIYVQQVAGGEPVRLTTDSADDSEPSFSPDGAHVAFSRRGTGLFVVGALGGEPRLVVRTPWPRTPRFSPDGRFISYWTGFPASVVAGGVPGALGSIFIVPTDGGPPRELRTQLASARYPIWSPDGSLLLFVGEEDADRKIHDWYVISREGGTAVKTGVVEALRSAGLGVALPIPGAWSARSHAVVFATNETDSSNVWQIRISPSTKRAAGTPERLTFGTAIERHPIATRSGRIAFVSLSENVDIWRVPLDPRTGAAAGPAERITEDVSSDRLRNVSADGRTMFFISSRTKRDEVWTKDLQSGRERQLTHTGVVEASGSPDGSRVAFSTNEHGHRRIDIVGADDTVPSKLCDQCDAPGGWSLDGKRLLYWSGVPSRLVVHDLPSSRQTELLTPSAWTLERAQFTPDGRAVTFHAAMSPDVRQIYTAPLDVDGPVPERSWVPVVTDHGCHPSWSPDGTRLHYFSFRDGAFCPWVQQIDPSTNRAIGEPRAVLHFHNPRLRAASGAAAFADVQAGFLYITLTEATGNIWMIDSSNP